MSAALVSPFYDVGDVIRQNMKNNQLKQLGTERIAAPGAMQRNRNFSTGTVPQITPGNSQLAVMPVDNQPLVQEHRKLDRSYSEPCDKSLNNANLNLNQKNNAVNSSRYKTELCRPFEESGHCKYADKCQFAHGAHELRSLSRHPKYKTELCRTFHSKGFCPYGPRCNFIHNEDLRKLNQIVQQNKQSQQHQATLISPPSLSQSPPPLVQRPTSINFNSSINGSINSTAESSPPSSVGSESPSLSPVFFGEDVPPMTLNPCTGLPSLMPNTLNMDHPVNNTVFNITELASALDMSSPLNIQTQITDLDLLQQFNTILNLNFNVNVNQSNNNNPSVFGEWDPAQAGGPLSSPDSISGDSVGSSFSSSSSSVECGSPSESCKNFRLPVFNHISQDL